MRTKEEHFEIQRNTSLVCPLFRICCFYALKSDWWALWMLFFANIWHDDYKTRCCETHWASAQMVMVDVLRVSSITKHKTMATDHLCAWTQIDKPQTLSSSHCEMPCILTSALQFVVQNELLCLSIYFQWNAHGTSVALFRRPQKRSYILQVSKWCKFCVQRANLADSW